MEEKYLLTENRFIRFYVLIVPEQTSLPITLPVINYRKVIFPYSFEGRTFSSFSAHAGRECENVNNAVNNSIILKVLNIDTNARRIAKRILNKRAGAFVCA